MEQSHHHINQSPMNWYAATACSSTPLTSTPISNTAVPITHWTPPTRSLKRALSESDCEDLYSEESSKEQ
jgi:YRPW motif-containing protein